MSLGEPSAVYYEIVHTPYYVLVLSSVRPGHDRLDRYASKPDGLIDFMLTVIEHLTAGKAKHLDRMCELDIADKLSSRHRTRRYIARTPDELYEPIEFRGFWFSTNADRKQAFAVIELACRALQLPFESVRRLPAPK